MNDIRGRIATALVAHFGDDHRRIDHALQVLIEAERLLPDRPEADAEVAIAAALLHDVGIKPAEEELGYNDGPSQERYGPPIAERILRELGMADRKIALVTRAIAHHHSRPPEDLPELLLLQKADAIVNRRERPKAP